MKRPSIMLNSGSALNPCARLCATNLEDLGRLGNCHCGIGSNFAIGGKILAPTITMPCSKMRAFILTGSWR